MQNSKLKKSMESIRVLEEKFQNALNENAKLQVKQKEDEKLWKGLESKFFSTKTLSEQLTETLQHLACQVQDGKFFFPFLLFGSCLSYLVSKHYMQIFNLHQQLRKLRNFLKINSLQVQSILII